MTNGRLLQPINVLTIHTKFLTLLCLLIRIATESSSKEMNTRECSTDQPKSFEFVFFAIQVRFTEDWSGREGSESDLQICYVQHDTVEHIRIFLVRKERATEVLRSQVLHLKWWVRFPDQK